MALPRQIVAFGGGGFSNEPDNPLLDQYVVGLTGSAKARVCFLPTASGDAQSYIFGFYRRFKRLTGKKASHLALTPPSKPDIAAHLLAQDVIYVGGGNTLRMLEIWRQYGVDKILREAYERGIILAGISAGAICWFEQGLTDSIPGKLTAIDCLGFVPGSCSPYYDSEPERRPAMQRAVAAGEMRSGFGLDDGAAVHFVDGKVFKIVTSRPDARAWYIEARGDTVVEHEHVPVYLGGQGLIIRRAALRDAAGILAAHHASVIGIAAKDYTEEQVKAWVRAQPDAETLAVIEGQIRSEWIWVAEIDGAIEGYVHMRMPLDLAPSAYLHALYLSPHASGRGIGKRLMQLAEAEAVREGKPSMMLHSSKTAQGFYEAIGYTACGDPMVHTVRGVSLPCFPMAKELGQRSLTPENL